MLRAVIVLTGLLWGVGPVRAEADWIFVASPAQPGAIYVSTLNPETGEFGEQKLAASDVFTGFLALHPTLPILYAATSEKQQGEQTGPNGFVRAYQLDSRTGGLKLLGKASTGDNGTTHLEVSPTGEFVAVCHYSGEGTSLIPLDQDGQLIEEVSRIKHTGSSVHQRQKSPHPHGVAIAHDGKYVCVADLGNDHVEVFSVIEGRQLMPSSRWKAEPGAGPRHVSFHPNGKWLYCINELDSTMVALDFNTQTGQLKELQTLSTLPKDFTQNNTTAEVVVHPNGKFLYGSNRGHNSTVVYRIDEETGKLSLQGFESTRGDHPRFIGVNPTGSLLLAANMNANTVVAFNIDQESGKLRPAGHKLEVQKPMCVVFKRVER